MKHAPWLELVGADRLKPLGEETARRQRSHSWMVLPMMLRDDAPIDVVTLKKALEEMGVETRSIIAGNLVRHPVIKRFETKSAKSLEVCDHVFKKGLMIGCHPVIEKEAVATLETAIRSLQEL
jgi:CDP-6-deoxy-D-xylo-4-hexulose-3-dehydrase